MPLSMSEMRSLEPKDLEQLVQVQQRMMGVALGNTPMEYPGAPDMIPGTKYEPNVAENEFIGKSRSILFTNLFKYSFLFAGPPYLVSHLRFRVNPKLQPRAFNRPRFWGIIGLFIGSMYGTTVARVEIAKENIRLENSPLATEARYQLWKLNPSHPFLHGFEYEFENFSSFNNPYNENNPYYRSSYQSPMTPQGNPQAQQAQQAQQAHHRSLPPPPYRYPTQAPNSNSNKNNMNSNNNLDNDNSGDDWNNMNNMNNMSDDEEEDDIRKKRRERFYRNKAHHDSSASHRSSYEDEADVSSFFESTSNNQSNRNKNGRDDWS